MIPIYEVISRLLSIHKLDLPGVIDFDGDLGGLAISRERRGGYVWPIGIDMRQRILLVSFCTSPYGKTYTRAPVATSAYSATDSSNHGSDVYHEPVQEA